MTIAIALKSLFVMLFEGKTPIYFLSLVWSRESGQGLS